MSVRAAEDRPGNDKGNPLGFKLWPQCFRLRARVIIDTHFGVEALAWQSYRVLDCRCRRNSNSCVRAVVLTPLAYIHVGKA